MQSCFPALSTGLPASPSPLDKPQVSSQRGPSLFTVFLGPEGLEGDGQEQLSSFRVWHSPCGSVVMNWTWIHEDAGSIPGFTQWVKDLALP